MANDFNVEPGESLEAVQALCGELGSRFPVEVFAHWMNLDGGLTARLVDAGPAFIRAVQANDPASMKDTSCVLYDMARELIA